MSAAEKRILEPVEGHYNMTSYEAARSSFSWDVETQDLHFRKTGQVNAAYEAIDRHVDEGHGEKTALHYMRGSFRQALSFQEVRKKTDHYARVLKESGVEKGDRVAVFRPKTPGCYIAILSVIKFCAIVVPLF